MLSAQQFFAEIGQEKLRADRSRAPLSLLVMNFTASGFIDSDDFLDIVRDFSLRKRATDIMGCIGEGVIAFLLPYAGDQAAEAFSALIIDRTGAPAARIDHATYPDKRFDDLAREMLNDLSGKDDSTFNRYQRGVPRHRWAQAVKRGMDVIGASVALLLSSPLMIATAIAVKLSSPGPIIFRQVRVGRDGISFNFYKFRSMRTDVDDRVHREYVTKLIAGRHQEINEGDARKPLYKLQSDPRITAVGRVIRKTSIDELPQLFNVLKGEMSLVGPRPPITYETEKYQSWHMRRLQEARPGITGLWQVQGRSKTTFDEMVRLDLSYIRNWSLWLDIKILFKTVVVVFRGDGAD